MIIKRDRAEQDYLLESRHMPIGNQGIKAYISNRLVKKIPIEDIPCVKGTKIGAKILVVVWASTGTVPYALISIDFAGHNALGYSMFSCNVVAYSSLNSWALLKMIDAELSPLSLEQKLMKREDKGYNSTSMNVILKVASVFFGVTSQLALGYLVYVYNNNNLSYAILTITSNSCFPSYSLFLTFDGVRTKTTQSPFEKKLQNTKDFIIKRINDNFKLLLEVPKNEQGAFLQKINALKDNADLESALQFFRLLFCPVVIKEAEVESCLRTAGRWLAKGVGAVFTVGRLGLIGITAFKAIEMASSNNIVCGIGAAVITGCNTVLSYDVCVNVNAQLYDSGIDVIRKRTLSSLAYKVQPKLFAAIKVLTLGITGLSWGSSYEVSHDYTSGNLQQFMDVVFPLSTVILVANAMHDLGDTLIQFYASKKGTPDAKVLLEFHERVNRFCLLLKHAPLLSFAKFLVALPKDIFNECAAKGEFTLRELEGYITENGEVNLVDIAS